MPPTDPPSEPIDEKEEDAVEPLGGGFDPTDPNSPLAPVYLRTSHLVALLIIGLCLIFTSLTRPPAAIWADLKFGQFICDTGTIPDREPFSVYSDPQLSCLRTDWLGQAIFYKVFRIGERMGGNDPVSRLETGLEMLRMLQVVLNLLLLLLLFVAYRRSGSLPLACLGLLLLLPAAPPILGRLRTEQFGLICFAGVLAALRRPMLSRRSLVVIPLLFVFWSNTHASFSVGLLLLAVFLVGRVIEICCEQNICNPLRTLGDVQSQRLLMVLLLAVGATMLNPYGPAVYGKLVELYRAPNVGDMSGWGALDFNSWKLIPILMLAIYFVLALTQAMSPKAFSPTQMLLILTIGVLPLWKGRLIVWWFVLVPTLLLPHVAAIGEQLKCRCLSYQSVPSLRKTMAAIVMAALLLPLVGPGNWVLSKKPRTLNNALPPETPWRLALQLNTNSLVQNQFHAPLAARLRESYPDGKFTGTILTTEATGDYLLWALPAKWPVFVYGELPSFSAKHWGECQALYSARSDWWELLDRRRINLIVVERERTRKLFESLPKDTAWELLPDRVDGRGQGIEGPLLIAIRKKPILPSTTSQP